MKRRTAFGAAALLLWLALAGPAAADKPDKGDRNADGKPGWGPPIHAPAHGPGGGGPPTPCIWLGCPNPSPPERPPIVPPEPRPDPEPVPEPPPVVVLPDTAL